MQNSQRIRSDGSARDARQANYSGSRANFQNRSRQSGTAQGSRQDARPSSRPSGYGSAPSNTRRSAGSAENSGRPMSDELINRHGQQRRQRPTGISFDNEAAEGARGGSEYRDPRRTAAPQRRSSSATPSVQRTSAARKDVFDLSYGEDADEEKLRKTPKESNSSRPVVISAMILAAVMLTVVIYAVTAKGSKRGVSDSDYVYQQPKTIELGGQKIDTTAYNVELSDNQSLTDINDLRYCFLLKTLILSNDNISDISALSNCTSLETLDLSHNNISNIEPIGKLYALSDLNLSHNSIEDISSLETLSKVEHLDIGYNNIEQIDVLANMTSLRQLDASGNNNISNISALANLTDLNTLELKSDGIFDISALEKLTKLTTLNLSGNNLSNISVLSGLTNLDTLDLSDNINMSDIEPLMELKNLSLLTLANTGITAEDRAKLKEALPNCHIMYEE